VTGTSMLPVAYRVVERAAQTRDSATLRLQPDRAPLRRGRPGQFYMLYARGIGEVPISISGIEDDGSLAFTIRDVGAVSRSLHSTRLGALVGVRGPFGIGWDTSSVIGHDLVIVAGGLGLAPLRPLVLELLGRRGDFGVITVIVGARGPSEFLFRDELAAWAAGGDLRVELTVDQPAADWGGPVGFVTDPLARLVLDPATTTAFLCGPEPMMRFCADLLLRDGLPAARVQLSLERNMQCGVGVCGHCQLGPLLVCRDGPVVTYATAGDLVGVREL